MQPFYAEDAAAFRKWLAKHHATENEIQILCYKKATGKPSATHRELMEEAICFGWIDTTIRKLDEESFLRTFRRRTNGGRWSNNTLSYAVRLIKEKKMAPAGLKAYKLGKAKPTIDHNIPKNPTIPQALAKALGKKGRKFYDSLPPSARRMYVIMVEKPKLQATKDKWIAIVVERCEKGLRPME